ncbi:MAG: NAD(P)-dependent oxidoreductase [Dongiaceae bacterium]
MSSPYRVVLTGDMQAADGGPAYPMVELGPLAAAGIATGYLPVPEDKLARAADLAAADAIILCECGIAPESLPANGRLGHIARFGVGFDDIAVAAATEAGVLVTNAPDGIRRPMAVAILMLVFALANRLPDKLRLARQGPEGWARIAETLGTGLVGRTLGTLGLGSIGSELMRLAAPFGLRLVAHDPFVAPERAAALGVELVGLEELCRRCDFLAVNCPLNPRTDGLLSAELLALMPAGAYLVNTSRGRIVDQAALTAALAERRIAGAALDVFATEPLPADDPLTRLDNVLLTPHAVGLTDQCFAEIGRINVSAILSLLRGEVPANVVNPAVLEHPAFRRRLERYRAAAR